MPRWFSSDVNFQMIASVKYGKYDADVVPFMNNACI